MVTTPVDLAQRVAPIAILGYLNFSDGRVDVRFHRALNEAFGLLLDHHLPDPHVHLVRWLEEQLTLLEQSNNPAFRDSSQVRAVLPLALLKLPRAFRQHHTDLLSHQPESVLVGPFMLGRYCEAVLAQGPPWDEEARILDGAIQRLNDFVGHRPIAVLETRPQTDYYPHEKVRPIPLYLRGVGTQVGRYHSLVQKAIELLSQTSQDLLAEASFSLDRLDELAFDPRAYDFSHPVNRRANYMFGEWDPHHLDSAGYYRRFVVRQVVLDALLDYAENGRGQATQPVDRELCLLEAAAVLAGTMLMASGISGSGPDTHDSTVKLGNLLPRNARLRDAFYAQLVKAVPGKLGDRLREEAQRLKQPFGGVRRHLNHVLARQRAAQLQDSELALLFAQLGFANASRERAQRLTTASARFLSEIQIRQTAAKHAINRDALAEGVALLAEIEQFLHRGIECGALVDPWNILGFQGLFPLFQAREDSIPDSRVENLIELLSQQFDLYARFLARAAVRSDSAMQAQLMRSLRNLAAWWDQFATSDVTDIPRLHGGERAEAAAHVARSLARWSAEFRKADPPAVELRQSPATIRAQLQFWRGQREGFNSPAAFAQVIEALIQQHEWHAAMGLLMTWLSEAGSLPLMDTHCSFTDLCAKWVDGVVQDLRGGDRAALLIRFIESLEANADFWWSVPEPPIGADISGRKASPFDTAYEGMSYQDSTDDGEEGGVIGNAPRDRFSLEEQARPLENRLDFLESIATLWLRVVDSLDIPRTEIRETLQGWHQTLLDWQQHLDHLVMGMNAIEIPKPMLGLEDVLEFQRLRLMRDQLTEKAIDTRVAVSLTVCGLQAYLPEETSGRVLEPSAQVYRALVAEDPSAVRTSLPALLKAYADRPLLFVPLADGGNPKQVQQVRTDMAFLEMLFEKLPRLGLLRETYHLIKLARAMEQNHPPDGRKVSDFERLYHVALRSVVESILAAAVSPENRDAVYAALRKIVDAFLDVWIQHSGGLRLSTLEMVNSTRDWEELVAFIRKYGRDLFTTETMHLDSIRGILNQGADTWLQQLMSSSETVGARLIEDIERGVYDRKRAARLLEITLQSVAENYDAYREYDATSTLSDYGENLNVFLDFVRIRVNYQRFAWRMRPVIVAHEVLCRLGHDAMAERWRDGIAESMRERSEQLLADLAEYEEEYGLRLQTIRDRLEERFVQPFLLDRLCSLVLSATQELRQTGSEHGPIFQRLLDLLAPLTSNPSGAGLETPPWLKRLQKEVQRVRELPVLEDKPVLARPLTLETIQEQLRDWERSLEV